MIWNSSRRIGAINVSKSTSMKSSNPSIFMNDSYLIIFPIYFTVIGLFKFSKSFSKSFKILHDFGNLNFDRAYIF